MKIEIYGLNSRFIDTGYRGNTADIELHDESVRLHVTNGRSIDSDNFREAYCHIDDAALSVLIFQLEQMKRYLEIRRNK